MVEIHFSFLKFGLGSDFILQILKVAIVHENFKIYQICPLVHLLLNLFQTASAF